MIPSGIFRSRWKAALWAVGILWTAYDVATANRAVSGPAATQGPSDAVGERLQASDLAILANAGG